MVSFRELDDFRQDRTKFKVLSFILIDSVRKGLSGTAGPENGLIAIEFPFMKVGNQSSVEGNKF